MELRFGGFGLGLVALVAYFMTGRVARRSPHYGSGTVLLSWIGFLVPCVGWVAMVQGYNALQRALGEATPEALPKRQQDKSQFIMWTLVYVFTAIAGGTLSKG